MLTLPFLKARDLAMAVAATREVLDAGGIVALPTETFYGLAVRPDDGRAVTALYALKGRAAEKALPIAAASLEQVETLAVLEPVWRDRLERVWPAPLSVILPSRGGAAAFGATVALRVPQHALLRSLLARVGPLTVTSANLSGLPPHDTAFGVARDLASGIGLLLDGGVTPGGLPSTILDLTCAPPTPVRQGAWNIPAEWLVRSA